ncbi:hypothetical protein ACLB2K_072839 [Fragaria x ananassa]
MMGEKPTLGSYYKAGYKKLKSRSHPGYQDIWIWGEEEKGRFTVHTAYRLARTRVLEEHSVSPNPSSKLWPLGKEFGQLKFQGKFKCVWKAASHILPTRRRLSKRGINIDTQCPFCEEEVESPLHTLRDCVLHAVSFLQQAGVHSANQDPSIHDWLVNSSASTTFDTLLMCMWAVWRNRNAKMWSDEAKQATEVVPITLGWWEEFKKANYPSKPPREAALVCWQRPLKGFVKLNVDASFNHSDGTTGLGGVFRDHTGNCLGVFSTFLYQSSSPSHGELLALLKGVQIARTSGFVPLLIETDCQVLVEAVSTGSLDGSDLGYLLEDLRVGLIKVCLFGKAQFY